VTGKNVEWVYHQKLKLFLLSITFTMACTMYINGLLLREAVLCQSRIKVENKLV